MSSTPLAVLDASVGVKWIKPEPGRDAAIELLRQHRAGTLRLVVPTLFIHEVVAVAVRRGGASLGRQVASALALAGLTVVDLEAQLVEASLAQCDLLGCAFYDALAPGLAAQLGAPLYSSDARAHAGFMGVTLL